MEERGGWQVPAAFSSVEAELTAARTAVALAERTELAILEVDGADLSQLAERLGVGEVAVGTAVPLAAAGADRGRWCRLTQHRARVLVDDTAFRPWLARTVESLARHLQAEGGVATGSAGSSPCLHLTDLSSGLTTLQVMGPRSPDLLARIIRIDLDPRVFRDRTVALTGAVGIPLQVLRWDWSPLLVYELTVGRDVAAYFWNALEHAGDDLGLKPIGAEALARLQSAD